MRSRFLDSFTESLDIAVFRRSPELHGDQTNVDESEAKSHELRLHAAAAQTQTEAIERGATSDS